MPTYKTVLEFSCETGQGWTESWYQTGQSGLTAAGAQAEILMGWRSQLIGQGSNVDQWTVIDVDQPRLSLSRDKLLPPVDSYPAATDNPVSSQYGRVKCVPNSGSRQFWCRGIPDSWVVFDPVTSRYEIVGVFKTAFENFRDFITNGNWALKTVRSAKASNLKATVVAVQPEPVTGFAQLTLKAVGNTLPEEVPIIVSGFKGQLARLNGTYLWPSGYARDTITITFQQRWVSAFEASSYQAGAIVRQQQPTYTTITQCAYERPGDRKVGGITGLPAGRR